MSPLVYAIRFGVAFRIFSLFKIYSLWFSVDFSVILTADICAPFLHMSLVSWVFFKQQTKKCWPSPEAMCTDIQNVRHVSSLSLSIYILFPIIATLKSVLHCVLRWLYHPFNATEYEQAPGALWISSADALLCPQRFCMSVYSCLY